VETGDSVLLLGDPRLRHVSPEASDFGSESLRTDGERLIRALERFRAEHGFGRAIAAPQLGIPRRMIAMNLGSGPFLVINPVFRSVSADRFTLWDDCMSFPWLMVRVERHRSLDLEFQDPSGKPQRWDSVEPAVSELLQHETDHLDGILAIDRAIDRDSIISRSLYLERRSEFDAQTDYSIHLGPFPGS
jgi:peptide deformylase